MFTLTTLAMNMTPLAIAETMKGMEVLTAPTFILPKHIDKEVEEIKLALLNAPASGDHENFFLVFRHSGCDQLQHLGVAYNNGQGKSSKVTWFREPVLGYFGHFARIGDNHYELIIVDSTHGNIHYIWFRTAQGKMTMAKQQTNKITRPNGLRVWQH
jgi:hypothetical protein